jgi:hypothetical protein
MREEEKRYENREIGDKKRKEIREGKRETKDSLVILSLVPFHCCANLFLNAKFLFSN